MSKNFFELFKRFNPMDAGKTEESPLIAHTHYFYKGPKSGNKFVCTCGESMSNDEVFETDSSTSLKRSSEVEEILKLIDEMSKNPPMRGDIALSDLRRKITGDSK